MVIEWTAEKRRQLQKEFSWLRARGICGSVNAGVVLCGGFEKLRSSPSKNNQLIAVQGETRPVAHAMFVPRIADRANTEAHFPPRSDYALDACIRKSSITSKNLGEGAAHSTALLTHAHAILGGGVRGPVDPLLRFLPCLLD